MHNRNEKEKWILQILICSIGKLQFLGGSQKLLIPSCAKKYHLRRINVSFGKCYNGSLARLGKPTHNYGISASLPPSNRSWPPTASCMVAKWAPLQIDWPLLWNGLINKPHLWLAWPCLLRQLRNVALLSAPDANNLWLSTAQVGNQHNNYCLIVRVM
jgi:hypothetical protein